MGNGIGGKPTEKMNGQNNTAEAVAEAKVRPGIGKQSTQQLFSYWKKHVTNKR